jgi:3-hydroxyanthranilate 3,4-dioxygenase
MERTRPAGQNDKLRWYCKKGGHEKPTIIHEDEFYCTDLGTQLKPVIKNWQEHPEVRTCKVCGQVEEPK